MPEVEIDDHGVKVHHRGAEQHALGQAEAHGQVCERPDVAEQVAPYRA